MKLQLGALLLFGASLSQGAIIVSLGGAPGTVDNINLDTELTPTTISGSVSGFSVLFTGQNGIEMGGGGQANILETDDPIDGSILFEIPGATFALFEVNSQRQGRPAQGASLLITAAGTSTTVNDFLIPLAAGENRLYVQGVGELLVSVLVKVQGDTYDLYKQPRVGGIEATAVPEPSTLAVFGAGLPVLFWLGKRYRKN
jgi:hypothetical protein